MGHRRLGVLAVAIALALTSVLGATLSAQEATPGGGAGGVTIVSPDEAYAGVSLGEWNARSWQLAMSLPEAVNPSFHPEGAGCEYGQFGPVFFLPGSYLEEPVTISCVVPEGTAILVSVGGAECSTVEPPPYFGRDEAELRACAAEASDTIVTVESSINGEPVPNLDQYRNSSPLFSLNLLEDNFFGVPAGIALSVADGYNYIIAPPSPGTYEVFTSVTFSDGFTLSSTVLVTVVAAQVIEPVPASPEASPTT